MRKAGRVGNDCVSHKRIIRTGVRLDAGFPAAFQHLRDDCTLPLNFTSTETLQVWNQAWVLDDEGHELGWVTANGVELQSGRAHEVLEHVVRGQAHAVAVLLQLVAQCDEGLYISPAPDYLYDYVELDGTGVRRQWRQSLRGYVVWVAGHEPCERPAQFRFDIDGDSAAIWDCVSTKPLQCLGMCIPVTLVLSRTGSPDATTSLYGGRLVKSTALLLAMTKDGRFVQDTKRGILILFKSQKGRTPKLLGPAPCPIVPIRQFTYLRILRILIRARRRAL